jgi:pyridoxal phosphate enzyme (YggS family)
MSVVDNYKRIVQDLPSHVRLVAVSKFHPATSIQSLYDIGHRVFGESRVQELLDKYEQLPKDIEWHFIGHLQTNKVKYIVPFVSLIHGIDSAKLLIELNKAAEKEEKKVNCLLQVHIAQEETKFGFSYDELDAFLSGSDYMQLHNIQICGLMGMASNTDDEKQVEKEFASLSQCFVNLKNKYFLEQSSFCELSMGMSGDYLLAIKEGSTLVRIGSSIFGERNY